VLLGLEVGAVGDQRLVALAVDDRGGRDRLQAVDESNGTVQDEQLLLTEQDPGPKSWKVRTDVGARPGGSAR
jgi:hypothetical protein